MRLLATPKNVTTTSYTHIAVVRCFGSGFVNCFCLCWTFIDLLGAFPDGQTDLAEMASINTQSSTQTG